MRLVSALLIAALLATFLPPPAARAALAAHVVISEIQTGGTSASDEFVELYNPTAAAVDLSSWSLQYRGGASSTFAKKNFTAGASIPAYGFYLVVNSTANTARTFSVTADLTYSDSTISLSATGGTVFLVGNQTALTTGSEATVVDKLAYGSGTLFAETAAAAASAAGQAVERKSGSGTHDGLAGNGWDTDSNSADFFGQAAPNPQNRSAATELPPDTTAPTDGASPTATAGDGQVVLAWSAATDDRGVTDYKLFVSTDGTNFDGGTSLGSTASHTATGLTNDTAYTFKIVACDAAGNCSVGISATATPTAATTGGGSTGSENAGSGSTSGGTGSGTPPAPPADTTAPTDGATFTATAGDRQASLAWAAATDDTAVTNYQLFTSTDGGTNFDGGASLGVVTNYTASGLTAGTAYTFKIVACDAAANCSAGRTATATPFEIATTAATGDVLFSEVAWAGSSVSSSDEWLELENTTAKTFDITNWTVAGAATSGGTLTLAGQLPPHSFLVVGNNAATHTFTGGESVLATDPGFISSSVALSNSALRLELQDSAGNRLDTAGDGGAPPAGSSTTFATMLRVPGAADGAAAASWTTAVSSRGFDAGRTERGSPGLVNFLPTDGAVTNLVSNVVAPLPTETVVLTATAVNLGTTALTGTLEFFAGDPAAGGQLLGTAAVSALATLATQTFTQSWLSSAGSTTFFARLTAASDGDTANNSASLPLSVADHVVISELLADPAGTDTAGEWVELFNPTAAPVELTGWRINGVTLDNYTLSAGGYAVIHTDPAQSDAAYTGSWTALPNSTGSLTLANATGETVDATTYASTNEGVSRGRTDGNLPVWTTFAHPTPRAANIASNQNPTAQITVQSASSCSLSINLDGSGSRDADGDALTFAWRFGDGATSSAENPGYHTYAAAGSYTVSLTTSDGLGGSATATQTFAVATCGGGGSSSSATSTIPKIPAEPELPSLPASAVKVLISEVAFDSDADFVELFVSDDGRSGAGADLGGLQIWTDKNLKTLPAGLVARTGDFVLLTFESDAADRPAERRLFSPRAGLTKTDEQLTLRDSAGAVEDAVFWENDGQWTRGEERDAAELAARGAWLGSAPTDAVSSADWQRGNVLARRLDTPDTDSAADWFATPAATPLAPNGLPPTVATRGLLVLTALDFKNPAGDSVRLACPGCAESGTSLAGFFVKLGTSQLFALPANLVLKKDEVVQFGGQPAADFTGQFVPLDLKLTGTDALITVKDFANTTADFVCWTDRSAPPSRAYDLTLGEVEQLQKRAREGEWGSEQPESCLDSRTVARGQRLVRSFADGVWADTQTAADWMVAGESDVPEIQPKYFAGVHLSEVLPDPAGADGGAEWVELVNLGSTPAELFGWQLTAGRGAFTFEDSFVLQSGEFKKITGLTLPNAGATVQLIPPAPAAPESVTYPKLRADESYAWSGASEWYATQLPTPDAANAFFRAFKKSQDRDGDGLTDSEEEQLKTDATKYDTDGDGLPDAFELHAGRDPRVAESVSAAEWQAYRRQLGLVARVETRVSVAEDLGVTASGVGVPGGTATVVLHSTPQTFTVPVGADGRWSFVLDRPLEAGAHQFFVQLADAGGRAGELTKLLDFTRLAPYQPRGWQADVQLSELFPAPAGADHAGEWLEIWNRADVPLDLTDFQIQLGKRILTLPSGTLPPHGYALVVGRDFAAALPAGTTVLRLAKNLQLPNGGGEVALRTPIGRVLHAGTYEKLRESEAAIWLAGSFRLTARATPGAANLLVVLTKKRTKKSAPHYRNGAATAAVVISEILPNPAGKDTKTEWVELWNRGDHAVNLGNWRLDDLENGGSKPWKIPDNVWLAAGEYRVFARPQTKLSFNNSGREEVVLKSWTGRVLDRFSFESPAEGVALARDTDGSLRPTKLLTPAAANAFDTQKLLGRVVGRTSAGALFEAATGDVFVELPDDARGQLARSLFTLGSRWQLFLQADGTLADFTAAGAEEAAVFRLPHHSPVARASLLFLLLALLGWAGQTAAGRAAPRWDLFGARRQLVGQAD